MTVTPESVIAEAAELTGLPAAFFVLAGLDALELSPQAAGVRALPEADQRQINAIMGTEAVSMGMRAVDLEMSGNLGSAASKWLARPYFSAVALMIFIRTWTGDPSRYCALIEQHGPVHQGSAESLIRQLVSLAVEG